MVGRGGYICTIKAEKAVAGLAKPSYPQESGDAKIIGGSSKPIDAS